MVEAYREVDEMTDRPTEPLRNSPNEAPAAEEPRETVEVTDLAPRGPDESASEAAGGEQEAARVAGSPVTPKPIEPTTPGEGVVESLKDAFRTVKDTLTPDEQSRREP